MAPTHARSLKIIGLALAGICVAVLLVQCVVGPRRRLVEQFDNGPVGGPPGASEGYLWVGNNDVPSPGKHWAPVDPATLTPEQRARIR